MDPFVVFVPALVATVHPLLLRIWLWGWISLDQLSPVPQYCCCCNLSGCSREWRAQRCWILLLVNHSRAVALPPPLHQDHRPTLLLIPLCVSVSQTVSVRHWLMQFGICSFRFVCVRSILEISQCRIGEQRGSFLGTLAPPDPCLLSPRVSLFRRLCNITRSCQNLGLID